MHITLTRTQEVFIRQAIESGRFERAEDAMAEALLLWEEREAARDAFLASLDEADASIERGEGISITRESMQALADDVKRRGRTRMTARQQRST